MLTHLSTNEEDRSYLMEYDFSNWENKSVEDIVYEFVRIRGDLREPQSLEFFIALMEHKIKRAQEEG